MSNCHFLLILLCYSTACHASQPMQFDRPRKKRAAEEDYTRNQAPLLRKQTDQNLPWYLRILVNPQSTYTDLTDVLTFSTQQLQDIPQPPNNLLRAQLLLLKGIVENRLRRLVNNNGLQQR